jgi:hypothetical protein
LALRGAISPNQEIINRVLLSKLGYSNSNTTPGSKENKSTVVVIRGITREKYKVIKGTISQ